jgi:hypothetical protein
VIRVGRASLDRRQAADHHDLAVSLQEGTMCDDAEVGNGIQGLTARPEARVQRAVAVVAQHAEVAERGGYPVRVGEHVGGVRDRGEDEDLAVRLEQDRVRRGGSGGTRDGAALPEGRVKRAGRGRGGGGGQAADGRQRRRGGGDGGCRRAADQGRYNAVGDV